MARMACRYRIVGGQYHPVPMVSLPNTAQQPASPLPVASILGAGNHIIRGDAEPVMHALAGHGPGSVRLALLDPPYNTKQRFHHYEDRQTSDLWLETRRRHIKLVHYLLTLDGSVWVHLDDSEHHYARVMFDEVFGRTNYVATMIWQKTLSRENRTAISAAHEYILVYAKDRKAWARSRNLLDPTHEQLARYANPDNDPRGPWTSGDCTAKAGPGRRAAQFYDVTTPSGRVVRPAPGMAWRFTRERFLEINDGRVWFGPSGANMPRIKRYLNEVQAGLVPTTWLPGEEVGTTDTAKKELRRLFPDLVPFETPKPEALTARIIKIASNPGDLVLDCYAGSGTTAAVSHKLGRRWITIERQRRTVDEVLVPRLSRVVEGEDGGVSRAVGWTGGGHFNVHH
jgi:adenine-specific DNA-methyltransferase